MALNSGSPWRNESALAKTRIAEYKVEIVNIFRNYNIVIIFLVAFVLRVAVFLIYRPWDIQIQSQFVIQDALGYHRLAQCIVEDFTFCGDTFRTPGYPFFIAIFYAIFGAKPWVVLFAQIFVDLVTIYYVFKIGEMLFSRRVGMIAATFLAIDPTSIMWTTSLYSDPFFSSFLWISLYFYLRGLKLGEWRDLIIAAGLLGLATLIKPAAQYYAIILMVFALLWSLTTQLVKLKYVFLYGFVFVITISPWLYRNYALYDTAKLSSVQGIMMLWNVAYAEADETHQNGRSIIDKYVSQAKDSGYYVPQGTYSGLRNQSELGNPFVGSAFANNMGMQHVKTHPLLFASHWIKGTVNAFINLGTYDIANKLGFTPTMMPLNVYTKGGFTVISAFFQTKSVAEIVSGMIMLVLLLTNYLTFLLGTYILIKRQQWAILSLFFISILYFPFTGGGVSIARYKLPIEPFYFLIGAVYIDQLLDRRALRIAAQSKPPETQAAG